MRENNMDLMYMYSFHVDPLSCIKVFATIGVHELYVKGWIINPLQKACLILANSSTINSRRCWIILLLFGKLEKKKF